MKLHIDMNDTMYDVSDQLVRANLKQTIEMLSVPNGTPVFSSNPKEEEKELKKLIKALKKVHNWYSLPEDQIK